MVLPWEEGIVVVVCCLPGGKWGSGVVSIYLLYLYLLELPSQVKGR